MTHPVRVGIGGWIFEPWDETFYPDKWPKARQLEYASRKVTAIEVNATFYRTMAPSVFAKWSAETPDDFVFCLKAHRFATSRKTFDDMKLSCGRFIDSGVMELGDKLGPINWQFNPARKFEADYFDAFLRALPREKAGRELRHVLEVRHQSFNTPEFFDLLSRHKASVVLADDEDWPRFDHSSASFVYARLMRSQADEPAGYPAKDIEAWAKALNGWSATRDVFAFFISGAKERNPLAAMAMLDELGLTPGRAIEQKAAKIALKKA
ncbi:MAG: DUF72 domain-containing protein [Alphaproteobacteria bacterium]|nr:DUF72 domain-containing protein [Alphaproteobacteria bacterium]